MLLEHNEQHLWARFCWLDKPFDIWLDILNINCHLIELVTWQNFMMPKLNLIDLRTLENFDGGFRTFLDLDSLIPLYCHCRENRVRNNLNFVNFPRKKKQLTGLEQREWVNNDWIFFFGVNYPLKLLKRMKFRITYRFLSCSSSPNASTAASRDEVRHVLLSYFYY